MSVSVQGDQDEDIFAWVDEAGELQETEMSQRPSGSDSVLIQDQDVSETTSLVGSAMSPHLRDHFGLSQMSALKYDSNH